METLFTVYAGEMMHAISWTLFHSIWQAMLIATVLSIFIKYAIAISARFKYMLSAASLLLLLATSICTFYLYFDLPLDVQTGITLVTDQWTGSSIQLNQEDQSTLSQISNCITENSRIITLGWMFGFCFFILRILFGLGQLHSLKSKMVKIDNSWDSLLQGLQTKVGYTGKIQLGESDKILSPLTFGFIKPIVLFPIGMLNQMSIQEVEAIMAHELAHIVRRDYLINFIHTCLESLYYFNPGVWIISAIIKNQREHCCDDLAISLTGNSVHYVKALIAIEENNSTDPVLAMGFSKDKKPLLRRAQRILNHPQKNNNMKEKIMMCCLIFIGLFFFTLDVNSKDNNVKELSLEIPESSTLINIVADTLPQEVKPEIKYDLEKNYLDKPDFEKLTENSNVQIVVKDGKIAEVKVNGKNLSEEEIDKIHYNLTDNQRKSLIESADIIVYENEEETELIKKTARLEAKTDAIRNKEEDKNRALRQRYSSELKRDKERIKADLKRQKVEIQALVEEAKQNAKNASRRFNADSNSNFRFNEDLGVRFADVSKDIQDEMKDIAEEMKELNIERMEMMEELAEEMNELSTELGEELRDLEIDNIEMRKGIESELAELGKEMAKNGKIIAINMQDVELPSNNIYQLITDQLLRDGLIQDANKFSFSIKKNKMTVNGKLQSDQTRDMYINMLDGLTDGEWSPNSRIKISKKGNAHNSQLSLRN